ncbi:hypothetical protein T484DRAFT_2104014 [Baffinella frigidus]|nr:hypothetical protein T484DRAFT_2104014 [Cryptophyta sp. CCMP2293]
MVASSPARRCVLAVALSSCLFAPASGYLGMSPVLRGSVGQSWVARQPVRVWGLARMGRTPGARMMPADVFSESGDEPSGSALGAGDGGEIKTGGVATGNLMKVQSAEGFFEEPEEYVEPRASTQAQPAVFVPDDDSLANAEGFFEEESGVLKRRDLHSMTVPQLKELLRERGLKVCGMKSELMPPR